MTEFFDGLVQVTVAQYAFTVVMSFVGGWFARGGGRPPRE